MKKANNFEKKEIPGGIEKQEYFSEEKFVQKLIKDIRNRFKEIFQSYKPEEIKEILRSNLIIGEDASGRLPALFLYRLSKLFRENSKEENNQHGPFLLFFAGFINIYSAGNNYEEIKENKKEEIKTKLIKFIKKHLRVKNINITVVTDSIITGESITPLIESITLALETLKEKQLINNIKIKLITLNYLIFAQISDIIKKTKEQLNIPLEVYYITSSKKAPLIFREYSIIGVKKGNYSNIYSDLFQQRNKKLVNLAHKKILLFTEELFYQTIKPRLNNDE